MMMCHRRLPAAAPPPTRYLNPFLSEYLPCFAAAPSDDPARAGTATGSSASASASRAAGGDRDGAARTSPVMSRSGCRLRAALPPDLFIAVWILTEMPRAAAGGGAFSLSPPLQEPRLRTAI